MSKGNDYEVGYGKPPQHTRFQKGKSGNPRGRPKKSIETELEANFRRMFDEPCGKVVINGEKKTISGEEAMYRGQLAAALKGNIPAAKALLKKFVALLCKAAEVNKPTGSNGKNGLLVVPEIAPLDEWEALAVVSQEQLRRDTWDDHEKGLGHATRG